jgi:hypothetical protein
MGEWVPLYTNSGERRFLKLRLTRGRAEVLLMVSVVQILNRLGSDLCAKLDLRLT